MELTNRKVLVVGLGKSGVAAARFLALEGASVTAADKKHAPELCGVLDALEGLPIRYNLGSCELSVAGFELVVASPGVSLDMPLLMEARDRGIPVVGEMELVLARIGTPIVAVTGTNGKTTTTSLIAHLMEACGIRPCVGGNIGSPLVSLVDESGKCDWVVLEVSSFQLETTPSLSPRVAVWLNVTPDHLDRHGSFEEYVALKRRLFESLEPGGVGIYNAADGVVEKAVRGTRGRLIPFGVDRRLGEGGWYDGRDLWTALTGSEARRFCLERVSLAGAHNRENMLAALLAAQSCGACGEGLSRGLESFRGLRHRLELVRELNGVRYYNDSKGTNVGATARALMSFDGPVVLIAGGQGKGGSFEPLIPLVKDGVRKLILIGEAADTMEEELGSYVETRRASSMDEAVKVASDAARAGDVVLLSPACASFDMFRDYAARGQAFADAVQNLCSRMEGLGDGLR